MILGNALSESIPFLMDKESFNSLALTTRLKNIFEMKKIEKKRKREPYFNTLHKITKAKA